MKIFVSIASYKDRELEKTVASLIDNADNPKNLRVVVLSQDTKRDHPDFSNYSNVELNKMDFRLARGVGYARKIIMDEYRDEDYFFQIDSHTRLAKSWDTKMLEMFEQAQEDSGVEKIILSQYPAPYIPQNKKTDIYPKGDSILWDRPSRSGVKNNWHGAWTGRRMELIDKHRPNESHSILAGYIFSLGSFVKEIPYDERISFMGEELCIALRAYTRGWRIYSPHEMLVWHFYTRPNSPKVWNQIEDAVRDKKWMHLEMESAKIQENILRGIETGTYGIDNYKKYLEYQDLVGINFNDFYDNKLGKKVNKSVLVEEINFSGMVKLSNWCIDKEHEECENKSCECNCHD
jgi:hypothetical protein